MSAKTLGDELHDEQSQAAYEREMKRRKSAIELVIEHAERVGELSVSKIDAARAELAALRATVSEAIGLKEILADVITDEDTLSAKVFALRATVEAQAQQLDQAREIIERQYTGNYRSYTERRDAMRAWLDVNPPAPQAQPE